MHRKGARASAREGFSLIELLAVILVIAILASILIPVLGSVRERVKSTQCQTNLRQIGVLVSLYTVENKGIYPTWRTWTNGKDSWVWDNFSRGLRADGTVIGGELPWMAGYYDGGGMTEEQYNAKGSNHLFNCPANTGHRGLGYAANTFVMREPKRTISGQLKESTAYRSVNLLNPGELVMIVDNSLETSNSRWLMSGNWEDTIGYHRHSGKANALYADFSVRMIAPDEISKKNIDPKWEGED